MCGIAGLFCLQDGIIDISMIRDMTRLVKHRGPDDEGFLLVSKQHKKGFSFAGEDTSRAVHTYPYSSPLYSEHEINHFASEDILILLGHRRLSILDLSPTGHQPMQFENKQVWITYNGEIFNYLEIRQELEQKGYHFHSHSDTEVILKAYHERGVDCLNHFNGMFAFLIIDLEKNRLFVARDRFGVKPLYLWKSPKGFLAFASEIKQFTCLPGWQAKANIPSALNYLLQGMTDYSDETMFEGVIQLRGGQYIETALPLTSLPTVKTWYRLEKKSSSMPFEEAAEKFHHLFEDAVRLRLRADVDIGSCLSGGLDSSSIVCMMHRLRGKNLNAGNLKTFSACSHVARFDEKYYMDEVIAQTGAQAHFLTPSVDYLFSALKDITWHQDEPFGSTSIYAQNLVFKMARQAIIKVILDGQGADEYLAGYPHFWYAHLSQLAKEMRWMKLVQEYKAATKNNYSLPSIEYSTFIKQLIPKNIKRLIKNFLPFGEPWINFNSFIENYQNVLFTPSRTEEHHHDVDFLSHHQMINTSLPALLRYEDRNSMAHSIETRTPFLDYRLVEFVFNLSAEHKISDGQTKKILRHGLKELLPEKIHARTDKLGFHTAEEVWMCDEHPHLFRQKLQESIEKSQGLLNHHALKMGDDILQRRLPFNWVLWRIINFGDWLETFSVKV